MKPCWGKKSFSEDCRASNEAMTRRQISRDPIRSHREQFL